MAAYNCTVNTGTTGNQLAIRNAPNMSGSRIGVLNNGYAFSSSRSENGWYYVDAYGGWVPGNFITATAADGIGNYPSVEEVTRTANEAGASNSSTLREYTTMSQLEQQQLESIFGSEEYKNATNTNSGENLLTKTIEGIYGIPYQFMPSVDRKLEGTTFGYTYADRIVTRMPLLLLTPGRVNFSRNFKSKNSVAKALQKIIDDSSPTDLNSLVDAQGRYYTFDEDYVSYYKYVDAMCMSGAYFLGIQDVKIRSNGKWTAIKDVSWMNAGNNAFKGILSKKEYIAFYVDSASSVSESFSNSTTESQLASKVNQFSDLGREISFLTGSTIGLDTGYGEESLIKEANDTLDGIVNTYLRGNQVFKDIASNFATVAVGGKLIFPEIWADSSYSKSYDINIKLRTPDGDKVSWFMNIYVPLAHLICLTAARQAPTSGANAYMQPFLVRGYYKGLFNCDMGIITDMSITRGREKAWTLDGLPTEVDVSLTLKDLYDMFTITSYDNAGAFVNNISLMDYIANSCGVNINEPDIIRTLSVYSMLKGHKITHILPNEWATIQQDMANIMMTWDAKFSSLLQSADDFLPL